MAPASRLLAFASRWFDERTVAGIFEPLIADYQREVIEASRSRRPWIVFRGAVSFAIAVVCLSPRALLFTPVPAPMMRRVLARITIFTGIGAVLLALPIVVAMRDLPPKVLALSIVSLLPGAKILAFPFAMIWVADAIRRHSSPTPIERIAALRVGVLAIVVSVGVLGWAGPSLNQKSRELMGPDAPPARGVREFTLPQLMDARTALLVDGRYTRNGGTGAVRRELNNRAVLALLPALLLWVRWTALARPGSRWFVRLPVAAETALVIIIFFTLYLASVVIEPALGLGAGTGMWTPLIALLLIGTLRRLLPPQVAA